MHVQRFLELDGLRGVAALVVVFHHALLTYPSAWATISGQPSAPHSGNVWWLTHTPAYLLFSGPAAVSLFFILSGAVLALTYIEVDHWVYWPYLSKRVCRIWLPFVVALGLSALLYLILRPHPVANLSGWFNDLSWNAPLTIQSFLQQAFMLGPVGWLDNPMWSLVHELRISIVFPLLLFATVRARWATMLATAGLAFAVSHFRSDIQNTWIDSAVTTLSFLLSFAIGAALMLSRAWFRRRASHAPRWLPVLIGIAGLFLLLSDSPANPIRQYMGALTRDFAVLFGGSILVALALGGCLPMLSMRPFQWLGRISYSLYLLHVPIILALLHLSNGGFQLAILVSALLLSLLAATGMSRWVERGSQQLGRWIAFQLSRSNARLVPLTS